MATLAACDVGNWPGDTRGSCRESPDFVISNLNGPDIGVYCARHLPTQINLLLTTSHDGGSVNVRLYD